MTTTQARQSGDGSALGSVPERSTTSGAAIGEIRQYAFRPGTVHPLGAIPDTGDQPNLSKSMRSVVIDMEDYDWEGDAPLKRPFADTVVYEMHVRGFTQAENSAVAHPGTFAGVVDKIPYLKDLGVTAVELLP